MKKGMVFLAALASAIFSYADSVRFLESVIVPKGAYVATQIVPDGHEAEIVFSSSANSGCLFGTSRGDKYYGLKLNNSAYTFGRNNSTINFVRNYTLERHKVLFNGISAGKTILDGEAVSIGTVTPKSTTALMLCTYSAGKADFEGEIFSFRLRNSAGVVVLDLMPAANTLDDGSESVGFYDRVSASFFPSSGTVKFEAGKALSGRLEIDGAPFAFSSSANPVDYKTRYDIGEGETIVLSAPASVSFSGMGDATLSGYTLYTYDPIQNSYVESASGLGTAANITKGNQPQKLVWNWNFTPAQGESASEALYVSEDGDDSNDGLSWQSAKRLPQQAIDAASEGAVIYVAPGRYFEDSTQTDSSDYRYSMRVEKDVSVIGTGGREGTVMDASTSADRASLRLDAANGYVEGFSFVNSGRLGKSKISGYNISRGTVKSTKLHVRSQWATSSITIASTGDVLVDDIVFMYSGALASGVEMDRVLSVSNGGVVDRLTLVGQLVGAGTVGNLISLSGTSSRPAILRNSLVARNQLGRKYDSGNSYGNIVSLGSYSYLLGCTVADNVVMGKRPSVVLGHNTARVVNCIVSGNRAYGIENHNFSNPAHAGILYSASEELQDGTAGNVGRDCDFGDAQAYAVTPFSPCVDAGAPPEEFEQSHFGTRDLLGNARKNGSRMDIGCYEMPPAAEPGCSFICRILETRSDGSVVAEFSGNSNLGSGAEALWNFGSSMGSTAYPVATNVFSAAGSYDVTLTVSNGNDTASKTKTGVVVVSPVRAYVVSGAQTGVFPYDTPEKATSDIKAAYDTGAAEILIGPGEHEMPKPSLIVERPVKICSSQGPGATTLKSSHTSNVNHWLFTLLDDNATVSGFTMKGGFSDHGLPGIGPVMLDLYGGTVTNCILKNPGSLGRSQYVKMGGNSKFLDSVLDGTGGSHGNYNAGFRGGIYLYGNALVDRCRFTGLNCIGQYENSSAGTGPIMLSGAGCEMRNSLITKCRNGGSANVLYGGIVQIFDGTVANCTIADNDLGGYGAVKFFTPGSSTATKGRLVNCIVKNNRSLLDDGSGAAHDVFALTAGAVIENSLVGSLANFPGTATDVTTGDAAFSSEEGQEWHLSSLSALCLGKAKRLDWMEKALDLDGNPRIDVRKNAPDIGCFEYVYSDEPEPLQANMDLMNSTGRAPLAVTLTVTAVGGATDEYSYEWNFGDGSATVSTRENTILHTYAEAGRFTPSVRVVSAGESISLSGTVISVPETCYVSQSGLSEPPYSTWESAATNIADAVSLAPGEILVSEGTHYLWGEGIVVAKPMAIRGVGKAENIIARGVCKVEDNKYLSKRLFWLNHPDSVIENMTFSHGVSIVQGEPIIGRVDSGTIRGLVLTNATTSYRSPVLKLTSQNSKAFDCRVYLNTIQGPNTANADGQYFNSVALLNGALMDRCVIKNGYYHGQGGHNSRDHAAVHIRGGSILRNSLVTGNRITQSCAANVRNAIVAVYGSSVLENCTIAGNTLLKDGAITIMKEDAWTSGNPVVRNNIVWNNVFIGDGTEAGIVDLSNTDAEDGSPIIPPRASYSLAPGLSGGEGNLSIDPLFKNKGEHPYSLNPQRSGVLNAGTVLPWMQGAVDIAGNPRIHGSKPAMGCYETPYAGPTVMILK